MNIQDYAELLMERAKWNGSAATQLTGVPDADYLIREHDAIAHVQYTSSLLVTSGIENGDLARVCDELFKRATYNLNCAKNNTALSELDMLEYAAVGHTLAGIATDVNMILTLSEVRPSDLD